MPKKIWWGKKLKLLPWENGPFVNVHMIRYCLHGVKHGKGKQCTRICAILLAVNSKFWNHSAMTWAHGGPVKAVTLMRKLNPDLAANLLQVVEMSLVAVPPSASWYPSCSDLLHYSTGSPPVAPSPWSLTSQNPHVPCQQCCLACELGWVAACRCSVTHSRPQTANPSALSFCFSPVVKQVFWQHCAHSYLGRGGQAAGGGTSKACSWKGAPSTAVRWRWWVTGGVPLLHACDITQF